MEWFGKQAYEGYCKSSGGVSLISGAKLPTWEELKPEIKNAWHDAAKAAIDAFATFMRYPPG